MRAHRRPDSAGKSPPTRPNRNTSPRRGRAAVAALSVILLSVASGFPAAPASAFWPFDGPSFPDPSRDLPAAAASLLAQSIRAPTVNPPGDERPLAELLAHAARRLDLEARTIETPAGDSRVGRAALWARVPGSGKRRALVLHSHLDVVPAEPGDWAVAPFEGLVSGGFVVGRGALDAKGITIVHLLALAELARRPTPLDRDVILLATPDEETGGQNGAGWIVANEPSLLRDAELLLTEGGGVHVEEDGSAPVWGVAVTEKTPCWMRITAHGTPGHASTEPRDAAVPRLLSALERVRAVDTEVTVVPEVARMFARLAPRAREEDRAGLADLARALERRDAFATRFLADRGQAALVRDTLSITVLRGASKTNVLPAEASAEIDARILPGGSCAALVEQVRDAIDDPGVETDVLLSFPARSSPIDTPLYRAIERLAAEIDPGAPVVPRVIAGFTDAHYFREAGIVSYGFVPRWLPASESRGIHGKNERVSIENLARGVRATVRLLELLDAE